jgi:gas vesicle protein
MSNTLNNTMDAAKDLMESAKSETQHAASSARSTLLDGIHAVSGVVSVLRALGVSDALGWFGLQRRRGPIIPLAAFGAGMIVGAGVGVLIAPRSGAKTRRAILDALMGVEQKVEAEAKEIEKKVVENAGAAKEAIKTKVEEAVGAVGDKNGDKSAERKADKPMSGAGVHRVS